MAIKVQRAYKLSPTVPADVQPTIHTEPAEDAKVEAAVADILPVAPEPDASLKPSPVQETINPTANTKIGPWSIKHGATSITIDHSASADDAKASGGVYLTLDDANYGRLLVLIAPDPKVPEEAKTEAEEIIEEEKQIAQEAEVTT
jgi:hypothetical protein